jgi:GNAT superfamily N-acetyltransferase
MAKQETDVRIRAITAADAGAVCTMSRTFNAYLRSLGDTDVYAFNEARYLADGFGADPAFGGFIAERPAAGGVEPLGYLLHCPSYNVDLALRELMIIDLWVEPVARGLGLGRHLMTAAADLARTRGAQRLIWAVLKQNQLAYDFYRRLGAETVEDLDWMALSVA